MLKVLIIDDEPLVRRSLVRVSQQRGHEVNEAQDGDEGFQKWIEMDPDLVFLDVLMPGLSGPQVLKELPSPIRAKVVLISAYTGEYDMAKAKSVGADLFIPKPFTDIFAVMDRAEAMLDG